MSAVAALLIGVAMLRSILCLRQQQHCADAGGRPEGGATQLAMRVAVAWVQALAACAIMAGLAKEDSDAPAMWIAVVAASTCLPLLVETSASLFVTAMRRRRVGPSSTALGPLSASMAQLLALRLAATLALAPLALWMLRASSAWWWLGFVTAMIPAAYLWSGLHSHTLAWRGMKLQVPAQGELGMRLRAALRRWKQDSVRVILAQAASRSMPANARAERFGLDGRVVLLESLVGSLDPAEVEAVLAHEVGHLACRHLEARFALLSLIWLAVLGLGTLLALCTVAPGGGKELAVVALLAPSLRFLLQPLVGSFLRRCELEADEYAACRVSAPTLRRALARLFQLNACPGSSDPGFAAFYESHPAPRLRLERLGGE